MWTGFLKLQTSEEYYRIWEDHFSSCSDFDSDPIFHRHITLEIFEQLLCQKLISHDSVAMHAEDTSIFVEKENAICYMAGMLSVISTKMCSHGFSCGEIQGRT